MAVAFNNTNTMSQVSASSFSGAMSVTAGGSNIVAFAVIGWDNTAGGAITSVTYGGDVMTSCGSAAGPSAVSNQAFFQVFYRINPKTGSNTLVVTGNVSVDELYVNLVSFTGVDQTTPVRAGTYQTATGSSATGLVNMTVSSNTSDLTLTGLTLNGGGTTDQTQDSENTAGTLAAHSDHANTPASSVTHHWSNGGSSADYAIVGFSIQAASSGITVGEMMAARQQGGDVIFDRIGIEPN